MTKGEINQTEKLLAIINLGLCAALKHQAIDIEEAEHLLFSPFTMKKLNEIGAKQDIIDLIHAGTELSDLKELIPAELPKTLSQMENDAIKFLSLSPKIQPQLEKWLTRYLNDDNIMSKPEALKHNDERYTFSRIAA